MSTSYEPVLEPLQSNLQVGYVRLELLPSIPNAVCTPLHLISNINYLVSIVGLEPTTSNL